LQKMDMNQVMYPELQGQTMSHEMEGMENGSSHGQHSTHAMPAGDSITHDEHTGYHKTNHQEYTCPMHPEVVSEKPGKCPKCGMDLVLKESSNDKAGHGEMDMSTVNGIRTLNYNLLKSPEVTAFPTDGPLHTLHFQLEG